MFISCLFVFLEVCSVTPTYRKSWAKNLLIWSDFFFKVKRCYNGFGEFSSGGYNLHRFSDALGLVIICILHNCHISIDSFIIFSLLINAVILLLNCLVLIVYLYLVLIVFFTYIFSLSDIISSA